jgi:glutamine amidotransferase
MQKHPVAVVRTGVANTASILAAFRRLGAEPFLTTHPNDVLHAPRVLLPGVGTFGAAIQALQDAGLTDALRTRVASHKPFMAICVGMQVLCESSEESPNIQGLGLFQHTVERFKKGVRIPQFGWNRIQAPPQARFLQSGYAYFANSYCLTQQPTGWACATAHHGMSFVAALEKGPVLACQFHPELSGLFGQQLLNRWLQQEQL